MGAAVIGVANSSLRADAATAMGAHRVYVIGDGAPPADVNVIVLTANPWAAFRMSVEIARHRGRVSVPGFPGRGEPAPDFNPLDPKWFYGKQLTLIGVGLSPRTECPPGETRFNLRRNLEYIFAMMAAGSLRLESIITHRFPANRMQEDYELARQHSKSLIAAIFDWRTL